jgi:deoxyribodipyrimidine photolyase
LPELAAVPDVDILDPTGATRRMQLSLPLFDGSTYPKPIVDHDQAARAFLARYAGFIKNAGVRR